MAHPSVSPPPTSPLPAPSSVPVPAPAPTPTPAATPMSPLPLLPLQRRHASKLRFVAELSQCLFDFVIQLLPTPEEMAVKEDVRKLLERLIRTIEPESRLLSFGSTANGFSLRNSDMDLCCLIDSKERLAATDLVTMLGDLLERETKFHVKPLPHARIPIVKLSLNPSPGLPLGIACDIGFENRLALENTRLLMCYAMVDPTRIRGEFMRASRVLAARPERAITALAELCEERREDLVVAPPGHPQQGQGQGQGYGAPRAALPPQTPYTVGSQSRMANAKLSPPTRFFEPGPRHAVAIRAPPPQAPPHGQERVPEHMAPRRSKWTSPPPEGASRDDHRLFESELGRGLRLATAAMGGRERERERDGESSASEAVTDEEPSGESDGDVRSVRSCVEPGVASVGAGMGGGAGVGVAQRRPSWQGRAPPVVGFGFRRSPLVDARSPLVEPPPPPTTTVYYQTTGLRSPRPGGVYTGGSVVKEGMETPTPTPRGERHGEPRVKSREGERPRLKSRSRSKDKSKSRSQSQSRSRSRSRSKSGSPGGYAGSLSRSPSPSPA
ncbi:hypothetical protein C0992_008189 [Termitomyces sp. T32_za158]|nr:hypothetical protein C0992_008189 [Termitomyces sp. T32_za158]